jgi:myosin-5
MSPHVYAIAAQAYNGLIDSDTHESQSILISGESGAGKTEATKLVLSYLSEAAGSESGMIEQRILAANPILEAFGNAKTLRNNNSSRFGKCPRLLALLLWCAANRATALPRRKRSRPPFVFCVRAGKFVQLRFDGRGKIVGCDTQHYLLEKTRIVQAGPKERSFHVFYHLCAGVANFNDPDGGGSEFNTNDIDSMGTGRGRGYTVQGKARSISTISRLDKKKGLDWASTGLIGTAGDYLYLQKSGCTEVLGWHTTPHTRERCFEYHCSTF